MIDLLDLLESHMMEQRIERLIEATEVKPYMLNLIPTVINHISLMLMLP